jgi:predicted hydrocarbon binding protein
MALELEYDKTGGIYLLNKIRVLVLPKGSLEAIQNSVNQILGLATKGIFQEVSSTVFYSFLQDMEKRKAIKVRGSKAEEELFSFFKDLGFGRISRISQDLDTYRVSIEGNSNSFLNINYNSPYCFGSIGILTGIYRMTTNKDVETVETKCRTTGDSDADFFNVTASETKSQYTYIPAQVFDRKDRPLEKVEIMRDDTEIFINSIPSEIIPATYFPYLFSKLRQIIGQGVYGIESQAGKEVAKIYQQYNLHVIEEKYGLMGLNILPVISGVGGIELLKTDQGYLSEIDVYNSFNALHIDDSTEKRCFFIAGLMSNISYKLTGTLLKLTEKECSSINNEVCKFSFE